MIVGTGIDIVEVPRIREALARFSGRFEQRVFTAGEIDPGFGGNQVLIAYLVNGAPLGSEGPAQIVAPGDKAGGRFVHNIATIEVKDGSK